MSDVNGTNDSIINLVGSIKEVEDSNIAAGTRQTYQNRLIEIMTHLFDTKQI